MKLRSALQTPEKSGLPSGSLGVGRTAVFDLVAFWASRAVPWPAAGMLSAAKNAAPARPDNATLTVSFRTRNLLTKLLSQLITSALRPITVARLHHQVFPLGGELQFAKLGHAHGRVGNESQAVLAAQ